MKEETEENEPYARLIYQVLVGVPGHRMVLKDIHQWFVEHEHKHKGVSSQKGWKNSSVRHHLSMNGVSRVGSSGTIHVLNLCRRCKKVEQDPDGPRKGCV